MSKNITRREAVKVMGLAAAAAVAGAAAPDAKALTLEKKMKVLLINGSPRRSGNTNRMLEEVAAQLARNDIASEIVHIGTGAVHGCTACGQCHRKGGRCVFDDDICNTLLDKMAESDGLVVGAPVYYGVPAGQVLSILQRMAYAGGAVMQGKPAAAVTVCRRGGATSSFQTLQMPFQMLNMPIVTSQYWNIAYGGAPGEVEQDEEGMQTMRTLADNMAYMLKQFASGSADKPRREPGKFTSFIR